MREVKFDVLKKGPVVFSIVNDKQLYILDMKNIYIFTDSLYGSKYIMYLVIYKRKEHSD